MPNEVTDPSLLSLLNGGGPAPPKSRKQKEVTDPALLAELDGPASIPSGGNMSAQLAGVVPSSRISALTPDLPSITATDADIAKGRRRLADLTRVQRAQQNAGNIMAPQSEIPTTFREDAGDIALGLRQGYRNVASGLVGLPENAVNTVNEATNALGASVGMNPGIPMWAPEVTRGVRQEIARENAADEEANASDDLLRRRAELGQVDGFGASLDHLVRNPFTLSDQLVQQLPQIAMTGGIGAAGKLGVAENIAVGAANAGAMTADQVFAQLNGAIDDRVAQMRASGAVPEVIANWEREQRQIAAQRATETFGASAVMNALVPLNAGKGAQTFERALAGRAGAPDATGGFLRNVSRGLGGEALQGGYSEAADTMIQNVATGDPLSKNVGQSAVLGALAEGPMGGFAGASEWAQADLARQMQGRDPVNIDRAHIDAAKADLSQQLADENGGWTPDAEPVTDPEILAKLEQAEAPAPAAPPVATAPAVTEQPAIGEVVTQQVLSEGEPAVEPAAPVAEPSDAAVEPAIELASEPVAEPATAITEDAAPVAEGDDVVNLEHAGVQYQESKRVREAVDHHMETGNLGGLLRDLSSMPGVGKPQAWLANRLAGVMDLLGVKMEPATTDSAGLYSNRTNRVQIRQATPETALHEAVHGATSALLTSPSAQSIPAVRKARAEIEGLLSHIHGGIAFGDIKPPAHLAKMLADPQGPMSSIKELVSYGMTNKPFQQWLSSIPAPPGTQGSNAWDAFKNLVKDMFGATTPEQRSVLDALIEHSGDLTDIAANNPAVAKIAHLSVKSKLEEQEERAGKRPPPQEKARDTQAPAAEGAPDAVAPEPVAKESPSPEEPAQVTEPEPATEPEKPVPAKTEKPAATDGGFTTSTKNEVTDAEREAANKDPIVKSARQAHPDLMNEADEAMTADSSLVGRIIERLLSSGNSHVSVLDEAVLLLQKAALMNQRNAEAARAANQNLSASDRAAAKASFDLIEQEISRIDQATRASGAAWGRFGAFRQRMIDQDYSLQSMQRQVRMSQNGDPLTDKQEKTVADLHDQIKRLQKERDESNEKVAAAIQKEMIEDTHRKVVALVRKTKRDASKRKNGVVDLSEFKKAAEAAAERIRNAKPVPSRNKQSGAVVSPLLLADAVLVGAYHLAENVNMTIGEFTDALKKMLGDGYDAIRSSIDTVYADAKAMHAAAEKAKVTNKTPQEVVDAIEAGVPTQRQIADLVMAHVRDMDAKGAADADKVLAAVTKTLNDAGIEIDQREVGRIYTNYGNATFPSKDADKTAAREIYAITQLQESIDRLKEGLKPLKSGKQRDKAVLEIRNKRAELNELLAQASDRPDADESRLRTLREARIRNQQNRIEDLIDQRDSGRRPDPRTKPDDDAEIAANKNRIKSLQEEIRAIDALAAKPGKDAAAKEKRLSELREKLEAAKKQLATGEKAASDRADKPAMPADEQAIVDEIAKVRRDIREAERVAAAPGVAAEKKAKRLESLREREEKLKKQLASGERDAKKDAPLLPADEAEIKSRIDALKKEMAAEDRAATAEQRASEKHKKAMDAKRKTIADLQDQIDTGRRPEKRAANEKTDEEKHLDDIIHELQMELRRIDAPPKRSADAIYQQTRNTTMKGELARVRARIAANDYSKPVRLAHDLNAENRRIYQELDDAKRAFAEQQFLAAMNGRSIGAKVVASIAESLHLSRAILTALDVSALMRQGGIIAMGHPVIAGKAAWQALGTTFSPARSAAVMRKIKDRPNYHLYKKAGLFISEEGGYKFSEMEERFASRWLQYNQHYATDSAVKSVGKSVKNVALAAVRASERNFTATLNALRVEAFDAMVATLARDGNAPTMDEAKAIARYVNVVTGRGSFVKNDQFLNGLNTVFFAPRLVTSRFQSIFGMARAIPGALGNDRVQRLIAQEYTRFAMGIGAVYALGLLFNQFGEPDDEDDKRPFIVVDPRSSAFMQMRFGDTYVNPTAGLSQAAVVMAKLGSGESKTESGDVVAQRNNARLTNLLYKYGYADQPNHEPVGFGAQTTTGTVGKFLQGKMAPIPGGALAGAAGEDVTGHHTDFAREAKKLVLPMQLANTLQNFEQLPAKKAVAMSVVEAIGNGVLTRDRASYKARDYNDLSAADKKTYNDYLKAMDKRQQDIDDLHDYANSFPDEASASEVAKAVKARAEELDLPGVKVKRYSPDTKQRNENGTKKSGLVRTKTGNVQFDNNKSQAVKTITDTSERISGIEKSMEKIYMNDDMTVGEMKKLLPNNPTGWTDIAGGKDDIATDENRADTLRVLRDTRRASQKWFMENGN